MMLKVWESCPYLVLVLDGHALGEVVRRDDAPHRRDYLLDGAGEVAREQEEEEEGEDDGGREDFDGRPRDGLDLAVEGRPLLRHEDFPAEGLEGKGRTDAGFPPISRGMKPRFASLAREARRNLSLESGSSLEAPSPRARIATLPSAPTAMMASVGLRRMLAAKDSTAALAAPSMSGRPTRPVVGEEAPLALGVFLELRGLEREELPGHARHRGGGDEVGGHADEDDGDDEEGEHDEDDLEPDAHASTIDLVVELCNSKTKGAQSFSAA